MSPGDAPGSVLCCHAFRVVEARCGDACGDGVADAGPSPGGAVQRWLPSSCGCLFSLPSQAAPTTLQSGAGGDSSGGPLWRLSARPSRSAGFAVSFAGVATSAPDDALCKQSSALTEKGC